MTGAVSGLGEVAALSVMILGVVAVCAAAVLLWRPLPATGPGRWVPWLLLVGGAAVILLGMAVR